MGKSNGHFQRKDGWIPPVIDGRNEDGYVHFEAYESGQESVELERRLWTDSG